MKNENKTQKISSKFQKILSIPKLATENFFMRFAWKLSFMTKIVKAEDGIIVNRFSGVNAENPDFNKDSNTVETQIHVRKLEVHKAVDKSEAKTGDTLTYQLTVENTGTARWVGTLTDKLTDDLQAIKTDVGSFEGNTLSVPIDLEQGKTQTITFTAKVLRKKAGEILNHASVIHENIPELNVESNEVKTVVKADEAAPTPTEPGKEPDKPDPTPTEPGKEPDKPDPTPTEPEKKPDEPDPTPTEPEDKPDEPDPTPTEPEDKPDEPDPTPIKPEKNQSQRGKVTNNSIIPKKNSPLKQNTTKMVNKAAKGKDLPKTGTHQTGYLWLGIVSLCLAGIVIYFDKKSRWHH